jgi:hypothetical protein
MVEEGLEKLSLMKKPKLQFYNKFMLMALKVLVQYCVCIDMIKYLQHLLLGFHNGVKKMHRILQQKLFWRYSYKSISEYVQNCAICKSNASPIFTFEKPHKVLTPWNEIEFHQLKPNQLSAENYLLLIIYDPASSWVSAAAVKPCSCDVAEFLIENFCNYGVASCTVYGLNSFEFVELKEE